MIPLPVSMLTKPCDNHTVHLCLCQRIHAHGRLATAEGARSAHPRLMAALKNCRGFDDLTVVQVVLRPRLIPKIMLPIVLQQGSP
jgi:hypothetical protein